VNTQPTGKHLNRLLTPFLKRVERALGDRQDVILAAWPALIGSHLAPMTRAVSFEQGVLMVHVKNSMLYSLLAQEKGRLIKQLSKQFPQATIRNITFRIGG
jgi:hypothetical protein